MDILSEWYASLREALSPEDGRITWLSRRLAIPGHKRHSSGEILRLIPREKIVRPGRGPETLHVVGLPIVQNKWGAAIWEAELASSIGAILTLVTGRRIEASEEWLLKPRDGDPFFSPVSHMIDKRLEAPIDEARDLATEFLDAVARIVKIDQKPRAAINSAVQLHYAACILSSISPTAAYTSLVAGIETLSRRFGSPPSAWDEWDLAASWDSFSAEVDLSHEQYKRLQGKLMKDRQIRLKETFAEYASSRLPESFYDEYYFEWIFVGDGAGGYREGFEAWREPISTFVPRDRRELKLSLKRSYDLRSEYVHTGTSSISYMTPVAPFDPGFSREGKTGTVFRPGEPLSFTILRSVLLSLIKTEIFEQSDG
jgi:hypothetical protein